MKEVVLLKMKLNGEEDLLAQIILPFSTKDIYQYHVTDSMKFSFSDNNFLDISITHSAHSNLAIRPDIINSRFLEALAGRGGEKNLSWNLFSDTTRMS